MYKGIEHTAIASPDPEALATWYDKTLGFPIVHRYGGNVFVRAPDSTMLEIIPSEGDAVATDMKTPGIRHLAIAVDDFDAGKQDLVGKGWRSSRSSMPEATAWRSSSTRRATFCT